MRAKLAGAYEVAYDCCFFANGEQTRVATTLTIGTSERGDAASAVAEATRAIAGPPRAGVSSIARPSDAVFAFVLATNHYDPDALAAEVSHAFGDLRWAGCSSAGVIAGDRLLRKGVAIGLLRGEGLHVGVGISGPMHEAPRSAGGNAVSRALDGAGHEAPRTIVLFSDALDGNVAEVVRGASREAGAGTLWAGGGAGDHLDRRRPAQFAGGRALRDHVVAVAIRSPKRAGVGVAHGWVPVGKPRMVTRARGDTVEELDYRSAFDVYRETAAELGFTVTAESLPSFAMAHPLGIPQADGEHVIRDPLSFDPVTGALRCVGEVPDGCLVRMMSGDCDALLSSAQAAANCARDDVGAQPGGALVFDCVSRFAMLGDRYDDEVAQFRRGIGDGVPLLGCLTFGEIGVLGKGMPQFHNKTAVVLALPAEASPA